MSRILIIGASGSGKTTLARALQWQFNIPTYDLDDYYWLPNWQAKPTEIFQQEIAALAEEPHWIISGNYQEVRKLLSPKADTIIWLDYSIWRCLWRTLSRSIDRIRHKRPCCNGNYETLWNNLLSKESVLLWIIKSYPRYRRDYTTLFNEARHQRLLRFKRPADTRAWLNSIKSQSPADIYSTGSR